MDATLLWFFPSFSLSIGNIDRRSIIRGLRLSRSASVRGKLGIHATAGKEHKHGRSYKVIQKPEDEAVRAV
jgi:hypothetical protein